MVAAKYLLMFFLVTLTACSTTSGIVPMGGDTYVVSRSQKGFDTTGSRVKVDALKEANEYCTSMGKSIEIIKSTQKDMVILTSDAQAEIEFRCVSGK